MTNDKKDFIREVKINFVPSKVEALKHAILLVRKHKPNDLTRIAEKLEMLLAELKNS